MISTVALACAVALGTASPHALNVKSNDRGAEHGRRASPKTGVDENKAQRITAAVRHAIAADDTLSALAKQVKVTTLGSRVTLRGWVETNKERAEIEADTRAQSGVTDVDNQLQVE